jgi:hypothetical protein
MSAIFTEKELSKYSITKALAQIVKSQEGEPPGYRGELSGLEREVDEALRSHFSSVGTPGGPMGRNGRAHGNLTVTTSATGRGRWIP